MDPKLVELLTAKATVLTSTRRLAGSLLSQAHHYFGKQAKVWETPRIYALNDWISILWDQFEIQGLIDCLLLNPTQALLRYEKVIEQSDRGKNLLQTHATAKLALNAWKILHSWEATSLLDNFPENIDEETFLQWSKTYAQWLQKNGCIDSAQLIVKCKAVFKTIPHEKIENISPVPKLVLYGFEEHPPLLESFFLVLKEVGWQIITLCAPPIKPAILVRKSFTHLEEEIKAAALWAKYKLNKNDKNHQSKIAIVTPHLTKQRNQIETIFKDCLESLQICDGELDINRDFNISAAIPLNQYPIIQAALHFLKLSLEKHTLGDYIFALTSPFVHHANQESFARAKLSAAYKSRILSTWTLPSALADLHSQAVCPELIQWKKIISELHQHALSRTGKKTLAQWSEIFKVALAIIGWPGERTLNSIEHQTVKRWNELLDELWCGDVVLETMTYQSALFTLEKLAANIPFQGENKHAPIQILGLLEAAGQQFDYLWVMGLHNEAWPESAEPNPFIPIKWQRKLKMPHASPEREMLYAQKVTTRLKESAHEIIFSYPQQEQEKTLQASALIKDIPKEKNNATDLIDKDLFGIAPIFQQSDAHIADCLENFMDELAPPVCHTENIVGSAKLLALQASCPFSAFAQMRLGAQFIEKSTVWLSPREQGVIIHRVLEKFWKKIQNSHTLIQSSEADIDMFFESLIDQGLKSYIQSAPPTYLEVEKIRLRHIFKNYLALEKQRAAFKVIAIENTIEYKIGTLQFKMRVDRIDELHNGDIIINDYKTGQFSLNHWWGDRLDGPQLPLYFVALQKYQPTAMVVTRLNSKKCEFLGVSENNDALPGVIDLKAVKNADCPTEWEALNAYWRQNLENINAAFEKGVAHIDPKLGKATCQYCQLAPLCRINERNKS